MKYPFVKPIFLPTAELQPYFEISKSSGFLSNSGPLVGILEKRIAELIETDRFVVLYSSGTAALMAALSWVKQVKGEKAKVVVPSFTFPATLFAILWNNLPFVFCDISDNDLCLDCAQLKALEPFDVILAVNSLSGIGDIDGYLSYCQATNKLLIFDSAPCFGNTYHDVYLGNFGDVEVFSFHASKVFPFGECGAIICRDKETYRHLRRFKCFGFYEQKNIDFLALNAKVSELTAAYGMCILDRFSEIRKHRIRMSKVYVDHLPDNVSVANPEKDNCSYVRQCYPIRFHDNIPVVTVQEMLEAKGMVALRYYEPLHHYDYFKALASQHVINLPRTESAWNEMLCLPLTYDMKESDIHWICEVLEEALRQLEASIG